MLKLLLRGHLPMIPIGQPACLRKCAKFRFFLLHYACRLQYSADVRLFSSLLLLPSRSLGAALLRQQQENVWHDGDSEITVVTRQGALDNLMFTGFVKK